MKSVGRGVVSAFKGRTFAGQAAAKAEQKVKVTPQDVKVTKLPSGVVVASLENYSPVSRIAVCYSAGSRHEPANKPGLTHFLRIASNLSTKKATNFNIAKQVQQIGGSLTCSTSREQMIYSVHCLRNDLATGFDALNNVATGVMFHPWELHDSIPHQKHDIELLKLAPEAQLIEALHKAAFRDTLGQSLYMPSDRIGTFEIPDLEEFVKSHYVSHNAAVAGVGVEHDVLVHFARKLGIAPGQAPEHKKTKYHGGELRLDQRSPFVHAAIATEGVSLNSPDALTVAVLQLVLGTGPYVKYSSNVTSRIGKAAAAATTNPFAVSSIGVSYSDSGLFGFQLSTNAKDAGKILKAVVAALGQAAKNTITDAEVQKAKKQLKACVHMDGENSAESLDWIGCDALLTGQVYGPEQFDAAIDKITLDQVNAVAKTILNGKPSMAAVGDLSSVPYLDELI